PVLQYEKQAAEKWTAVQKMLYTILIDPVNERSLHELCRLLLVVRLAWVQSIGCKSRTVKAEVAVSLTQGCPW
ncbi:hypothetical protein ACQCVP_24260, partial [Rossellomorea vietnamensis]|uniref:hypothetical protein n=1 Tax=Rossellomorea vietnamensis TaxID=218284 RepID=UPI003CEE2E6A